MRRSPTQRDACFCFLIAIGLAAGFRVAVAALPDEPVDLGSEPQFLIDDWIVDNSWALKRNERLTRVFHAPRKYEKNPVIADDGGYVNVLRDEQTGALRMWYQSSIFAADEARADYAVAYAESRDGVNWDRPRLEMFEWKGNRANNIVWPGLRARRASGPCLLDVPSEARRGYRYVMSYRDTDGIHLIGSRDGIQWDRASDTLIVPKLHSDTLNSIVYDSARREYVMFCRAKQLYRARVGEIRDIGESRRVARMSSKELWTEWRSEPQNILLPDELDHASGFNCFYGMGATHYAGIYWGFLWPFKMNTDIHSELAFSRDGAHFDRLPARPKLIAMGPAGAWDDGMVFAGHQWIEAGNEWWMYYAGWDGPHGTRDRKVGIGLVKLRKEGFVSLRGPRGGGVVVTRKLKWPGGKLVINADAREGELRVRVSDAKRGIVPGFDYDDCVPLRGDTVSSDVAWKNGSLEGMAGRVIRLEFWLTNADLYTFRVSH